MGEESKPAPCQHSSRFSFSGVDAGASNTCGSSNDIILEKNALFPNLSGAISMARGDRGSRHSCFSENSMATAGSRRSARLSIAPFSVDVHHSEESDGADGVSSLLCTCLTANYISVGYLLVPWAFANAGVLLTTVVLSLVMLQSFITSTYVMESCARAEFLATHCSVDGTARTDNVQALPSAGTDPAIRPDTERDFEKGASEHSTVSGALALCPVTENQERLDGMNLDVCPDADNVLEKKSSKQSTAFDRQQTFTTLAEEQEVTLHERTPWWYQHMLTGSARNQKEITSNRQRQHVIQTANALLPDIRHRKFEMPELCRIFIGDVSRIVFTCVACCDLYGLMWSIAAVSASSLASDIPILHNQDDYMIYILIFATTVIPLSFLSVADQVWIQIAFFAGRMLMVILMLVTVAAAFGASEAHFADQDGPQPTSSLANFSMLSVAIQICIFSTAFQFSVPVIAEVLANKPTLRRVYCGSTTFICASVLILSVVLASYFGNDLMEKSSNVNWSVYHGGTGTYDEDLDDFVGVAWWARFVSRFVTVYPAVDGISNFVLCAIAIGEITTGAWYGDSVHSLEPSWKRRLCFRLVGSIPPLVGAVFVSDLSAIANYAGLFTVASYTICPCLLQVYSSRAMKQAGYGSQTSYNTFFSSEGMAWMIGFSGAAMILYAIIGSVYLVSSD